MTDKKPSLSQSKLFKLKKWLLVPDAARYLSMLFNEEVNEADVLRLALDSHLTLSVDFVNHAYVRRGKIVSEKDAIWFEFPMDPSHEEMIRERSHKYDKILDEAKEKSVRYMMSLNIDDERFINLEDEVTGIDGVWDLSMIGCEQLDIEHQYQMLTGGPEITLVNIEGLFVERDEVICQVQERFSDKMLSVDPDNLTEVEEIIVAGGTITKEQLLEKKKERAKRPFNHPENFFPAGGLPHDSVLVVRTKELIDLQEKLVQTDLKKDAPLDNRSETTYLNIIGSLLEVVTGNFKGETFSSETQLREFLAEKFKGFRGVSERTLAEKFAQAKKTINEDSD